MRWGPHFSCLLGNQGWGQGEGRVCICVCVYIYIDVSVCCCDFEGDPQKREFIKKVNVRADVTFVV